MEKTTKILWLSRHQLTAEQLADLKRIYGEISIKSFDQTVSSWKDVVEVGKDCDVLALDSSVFLILDLIENVDFDYDDKDEVKVQYYESFLRLLYPKNSNLKDTTMEYWNMHTYSYKHIDKNKISILSKGNNIVASDILKYLIEISLEYVKENLKFLYEYYIYIYRKEPC